MRCDAHWILDIDTTIKPLYGKQEGAQVSNNPHKPGRPSHALHTYWVANLRLVIDVFVSPGKEHSAGKACPGLMHVLGQLSPEQRPKLVRDDCGFGNEPFIAELEEGKQSYLFKLKQTAGVKKLLTRQFAREDWSTPAPKRPRLERGRRHPQTLRLDTGTPGHRLALSGQERSGTEPQRQDIQRLFPTGRAD